jgi:hypothetical protein
VFSPILESTNLGASPIAHNLLPIASSHLDPGSKTARVTERTARSLPD